MWYDLALKFHKDEVAAKAFGWIQEASAVPCPHVLAAAALQCMLLHQRHQRIVAGCCRLSGVLCMDLDNGLLVFWHGSRVSMRTRTAQTRDPPAGVQLCATTLPSASKHCACAWADVRVERGVGAVGARTAGLPAEGHVHAAAALRHGPRQGVLPLPAEYATPRVISRVHLHIKPGPSQHELTSWCPYSLGIESAGNPVILCHP